MKTQQFVDALVHNAARVALVLMLGTALGGTALAVAHAFGG